MLEVKEKHISKDNSIFETIDNRLLFPKIKIYKIFIEKKEYFVTIKEFTFYKLLYYYELLRFDFTEKTNEILYLALKDSFRDNMLTFDAFLSKLSDDTKNYLLQLIEEINDISDIVQQTHKSQESLEKTQETEEVSFPPNPYVSIGRLLCFLSEKWNVLPIEIIKNLTFRQIMWYLELLLEETREKTEKLSAGKTDQKVKKVCYSDDMSDVERRFYSKLPADARLVEDTGGMKIFRRTYRV